MNCTWSVLGPLGRWVARHLARLGQALDDLAHQLREEVAQLVGQSVAEAVREVVQTALQPDALSPVIPAEEGGPEAERPTVWDEGPEVDDSFLPVHGDVAARPSLEEERPPIWRGAMTAACRAASWGLQRYRARFPLLATAGLVVLAWAAAWVGGTPDDMALGHEGLRATAQALQALGRP